MALSRNLVLLPLLSVLTTTLCQSLQISNSLICPSGLNEANATGTALFHDLNAVDDFDFHGQQLPPNNVLLNGTLAHPNASVDFSWTVSVTQNPPLRSYGNQATVITEFWIGQPPNPYVDNSSLPVLNLYDGDNGYSACAFVLTGLSESALRRGQSDNGSCQATLSNECIDALTSNALQAALPLTTNLDNLDGVFDLCDIIGSAAGYTSGSGSFPKECLRDLNLVGSTTQAPAMLNSVLGTITTNDTSYYSNPDALSTCFDQDYSILPDYTLRSVPYKRDFPYTDNSTGTKIYDQEVSAVYPILTVFFPQANDTRSNKPSLQGAYMTCPRLNLFSGVSRIPPPLSNGGPSIGAKAGIAVGVAVGVCLLSGLAFLFVRRRQRKVKQLQPKEEGWVAARVGGEPYHMKDNPRFEGGGIEGAKGGLASQEQEVKNGSTFVSRVSSDAKEQTASTA